MIRTQVYLTKELSQKVKLTALKEKKPAAVVVREILEVGFKDKTSTMNSGFGLLNIAKLAKKLNIRGPKDLSANLDNYLYGDK